MHYLDLAPACPLFSRDQASWPEPGRMIIGNQKQINPLLKELTWLESLCLKLSSTRRLRIKFKMRFNTLPRMTWRCWFPKVVILKAAPREWAASHSRSPLIDTLGWRSLAQVKLDICRKFFRKLIFPRLAWSHWQFSCLAEILSTLQVWPAGQAGHGSRIGRIVLKAADQSFSNEAREA